jgi:uncharacterized membrane protein SpoIIM required for sporulation
MLAEHPVRRSFLGTVPRALFRARLSILAVAVVYFLSVTAGIIMVSAGNGFAVRTRDSIVGGAQSSATLQALDRNDRVRAALLDFGGNLLAAVSNTLAGLGVVFPFPIIAYRGWVGGIVSIDGAHVSRLIRPGDAAYYLITLILQLIPFTLSAGAGVNLGLSLWKPGPEYRGEKWLGMPKETILDVLRIYWLVIPLFLIASLWEFLAV